MDKTPSESRLAIAAHLHVLLRRKIGRVTDTEWMACNSEYAQTIVRLARERGREEGMQDLLEWADKLEQSMQAQRPQQRALPALAEALRAGEPEVQRPEVPRYVGGIR